MLSTCNFYGLLLIVKKDINPWKNGEVVILIKV